MCHSLISNFLAKVNGLLLNCIMVQAVALDFKIWQVDKTWYTVELNLK